jgi:hypothetical protein
MAGARLPDFVVVGVMKAGTTTLFRWLDEHPGVQMPADKEPGFFSDDRAWRRGPQWYASLFADVPDGIRTGEASVAYADPGSTDVVVPRLVQTLPDARLVCLLRDPVARLRSHYRHEVLRGRETRPLPIAAAAPDNPYVRRSSYARVLRPWLGEATASRLHVAVSEELFADAVPSTAPTAWSALLTHLDLADEPPPRTVHNATEGKAAFTPVMRVLWDSGLVERLPRPPRALRGLARRALLRGPDAVGDLLSSASEPLPDAVVDLVTAEVAAAEELLGRPLPYPRTPA